MLEHTIDKEVSLRLFTNDDSKEFYHLVINSKDHLKKWLTWVGSIETRKDTDESLKLRINSLVENDGYPTWFAIMFNGEMSGAIGFNEIDKANNVGELGYFLGDSFQHKGIMSRAFEMVIEYGFKTLKLNRIEAYIADGNEKSKALPKRFGFLGEGRIRQAEWLYDHYEDEIIYGLLVEDWKKLHPEKMEHNMGLYEIPFNSIKSGRKTVEVRLYDNKRRKLKLGDTIKFTKVFTDSNETITVKVVGLRKYSTFKELYENIPANDLDAIGGSINEMVEQTYQIYSPKEEKEWGAIAILIKLLN